MKNSLWAVIAIVAGFVGFLIGYAQQPPDCTKAAADNQIETPRS